MKDLTMRHVHLSGAKDMKMRCPGRGAGGCEGHRAAGQGHRHPTVGENDHAL